MIDVSYAANVAADTAIHVAGRIRNMLSYGMSRDDIHGEIVLSCEVPEDVFYLAWCLATLD